MSSLYLHHARRLFVSTSLNFRYLSSDVISGANLYLFPAAVHDLHACVDWPVTFNTHWSLYTLSVQQLASNRRKIHMKREGGKEERPFAQLTSLPARNMHTQTRTHSALNPHTQWSFSSISKRGPSIMGPQRALYALWLVRPSSPSSGGTLGDGQRRSSQNSTRRGVIIIIIPSSLHVFVCVCVCVRERERLKYRWSMWGDGGGIWAVIAEVCSNLDLSFGKEEA